MSERICESQLVGRASGAGKTRILEAILDLQRIANGKSLSGVAWDIEFSAEDVDYRWKGEFENTRANRNTHAFLAAGGRIDSHENKLKILYIQVITTRTPLP